MSIDKQIEQWAKEHDIPLSLAAMLSLGRILESGLSPVVHLNKKEEAVAAEPQYEHDAEELALRISYTAYINSIEDELVLTVDEWSTWNERDTSFIQAIRNIITEARRLK